MTVGPAPPTFLEDKRGGLEPTEPYMLATPALLYRHVPEIPKEEVSYSPVG